MRKPALLQCRQVPRTRTRCGLDSAVVGPGPVLLSASRTRRRPPWQRPRRRSPLQHHRTERDRRGSHWTDDLLGRARDRRPRGSTVARRATVDPDPPMLLWAIDRTTPRTSAGHRVVNGDRPLPTNATPRNRRPALPADDRRRRPEAVGAISAPGTPPSRKKGASRSLSRPPPREPTPIPTEYKRRMRLAEARELVDLLDGAGRHDRVAVLRLRRWRRARGYQDEADRVA